MEQANAFVALAGDKGNSVPKTVTPAEVEILRRVHGDDAVHDISGVSQINRSKQQELSRLHEAYHQPRDEDGKRLVATMFPSHTLLPMTFEELSLPAEFYAATGRAVPQRTVEVPVEQVHGRPGEEPLRTNWPNTGFEPIEVPADPETQPEQVGRMVDPRTQHQNDEAPGAAIQATDDGSADQLRARAEAQGTGPGSVPTQTGARTQGGPVETGGSKTAEQMHAEVAPKPQEGDKGSSNAADALFS
jgi:hypothetical protein